MIRDINRALEHVERVMARALEKSSTKPPEAPKIKSPTIRGWRAPASNDSQYAEPKTRSVFRENSNVTKPAVTARAIKVTIPLDPAAVGALPLPNQERAELIVGCDGHQYVTSVSTKSLRKAKNTISANGADAVFVMLQGKLRGHEIIECGLVAQIKVVKTTQDAAK